MQKSVYRFSSKPPRPDFSHILQKLKEFFLDDDYLMLAKASCGSRGILRKWNKKL